MEFRQRKLYLALTILTVGMGVAAIWSGCGFALGYDYPYNTFLFRTNSSLSDFTDFLYDPTLVGNYFPSAVVIFLPFRHLPPVLAAQLFEAGCVVGLAILLWVNLQRLALPRKVRLFACLALLGSYPMLVCLDRGNIEILIALCVAASLSFYFRGKYGLSFWFLLPAICFKFYPGIFLLLFCRRKLFHWAALGAVAFFLVNWAFAQFLTPVAHGQAAVEFNVYTDRYVLGAWGVSGSASAWNLFRLGVWSIYGFVHGTFAWPLPQAVVVFALKAYYVIAVVGGLLVIAHVLFVEQRATRKAILLLLFATVSVPGGSDYKLLHAMIALVVLILDREHRPGDTLAVAALAFSLIPKPEIFLPFIYNFSSSSHDAAIGVILNPLCELAALAILVWNVRNRLPTPADL